MSFETNRERKHLARDQEVELRLTKVREYKPGWFWRDDCDSGLHKREGPHVVPEPDVTPQAARIIVMDDDAEIIREWKLDGSP